MNENLNTTGQTTGQDNILQHIQSMIGDLLKNTVDKMQKAEINKQLGEAHSSVSDGEVPQAQMDISEIKGFIDVMQKFIDNVKLTVAQLETGSTESGGADKQFLDGYMATADNILEIAAFSMKDPVTGLSNRYGFDNRLILEWNRAIRDKAALSLVIFGVDGLSECKDNNIRDDILKNISETLENSIKRSTDFMARWSDDEFAALLPFTSSEGASIVAERVHAEIGGISIPGIAEKGGKSTVSIGVCVHMPELDEQPVDFINKAHKAFIEAKTIDGNSVIYA